MRSQELGWIVQTLNQLEGRSATHFDHKESYEYRSSSLPSGTFDVYLYAVCGDLGTVISFSSKKEIPQILQAEGRNKSHQKRMLHCTAEVQCYLSSTHDSSFAWGLMCTAQLLASSHWVTLIWHI